MEIGAWARAGEFVGVVSAVDEDGTLVLFNPGDRQVLRATPGAVTALPTGEVDVRIDVRLTVPHGLGEESVQRWVAALVDPVIRQRARDSVEEAGMDPSPFTPDPTVQVTEAPSD